MNGKKVLTAALSLVFSFALGAETRFLGGIEASVGADVPRLAGLMDATESLSLGVSLKAFTAPLGGFSHSLGVILETNLVEGGWLVEFGSRMPIELATGLWFEPGVAFAGGWRSQGYILPYGMPYGALSADVPIVLGLDRHLALRLGARASLWYMDGHHFYSYRDYSEWVESEGVFAVSFPIALCLRLTL